MPKRCKNNYKKKCHLQAIHEIVFCLQLNEWSQMRKEIEQLKLLFSVKDQLKAPPRGEAKKEKRWKKAKWIQIKWWNSDAFTPTTEDTQYLNVPDLLDFLYAEEMQQCATRRSHSCSNVLIATLAKPFICLRISQVQFSPEISWWFSYQVDLLLLDPDPGKEQRALGFHWIRQRGVLHDFETEHSSTMGSKSCDMLWQHVTQTHINLL